MAIAPQLRVTGGIDRMCAPSFADLEIDGERRTALRLVIEGRHHRAPSASAPAPPVLTDLSDVGVTGSSL